LTIDQAIYHFISGFTSKIAGTERGIVEPQPTFSACYGAPFLPRDPSVYGNLLRQRLIHSKANCWLVNTGWTGGSYGEGIRMPLKETRKILTSVLDNTILNSNFRIDENFGFQVPLKIEGVDGKILNPRETWIDKNKYDDQSKKLVKMFIENFSKYEELENLSKILVL